MRGIVELDSVLVIEDQRGGLKAHAMLFQVQRGLVRVPLELHGQFPLVLYDTIITEMPASRKAYLSGTQGTVPLCSINHVSFCILWNGNAVIPLKNSQKYDINIRRFG